MPALLNSKQERFAVAYSQGHTGAESYRQAGYAVTAQGSAASGANRLLRIPEVADRIQELQAAVADRVQIDKAWCMDQLVEIVNRCTQAVPVKDKNGKKVAGEWTFDHVGANRALDLLLRHFGLATDALVEGSAQGGQPNEGAPIGKPGWIERDLRIYSKAPEGKINPKST